jgi:hypothetical protein
MLAESGESGVSRLSPVRYRLAFVMRALVSSGREALMRVARAFW